VTVQYAQGCAIATNDTSGFDAACAIAQTADAVVVVLGLDQTQEREGLDRVILTFPGVQSQLLSKLQTCSRNPVTLVMMNGGSVDLSEAKASNGVGAIVWIGYPGQSGGAGLAEVLFGVTNPSGRMPYTIYPAAYGQQVSMFDMNMRPNGSYPGRTYRFYTGQPVYPFGYGLSYTTFDYQYSDAKNNVIKKEDINSYLVSDVADVLALPKLTQIAVNVSNVGNVAGKDAVLAFIVGPDPGQNGNPIRSLFAFQKIYLLAGQSQVVVFGATAYDLSVVSENGKRSAQTGVWSVEVGSKIIATINVV